MMRIPDGKKIDLAGSTGGIRYSCQPSLIGQGIDDGGFSDIGAAGKTDFWPISRG